MVQAYGGSNPPGPALTPWKKYGPMSSTQQENNSATCAAVVLAAGKGTRMRSQLPKVATELLGRPLLVHVLQNLYEAGVRRFVIVVGYKREVVQALIPELPGARFEFAFQAEQNGTAHAFLCAREQLKGYKGAVLVASGDMPALRAATLRTLIETHTKNNNRATVLSAIMPGPTGFGRLVRNAEGKLKQIIEEKDASAEIRQIDEVNTGTYVFEAPEIFEQLTRIGTENVQNEYYLPDVVELYSRANQNVDAMVLDDADEALGINSPEDLQKLATRLEQNVSR